MISTPPRGHGHLEVDEPSWGATLARRIEGIRSRIAAATARRGSNGCQAPPRLVAVAKKHPAEAIRAAFAAGVTDIGENYAQEFLAKHDALEDLDVRWHFVGALQSNKVKLVVGKAMLLHTLDRPSLLRALETRASALGLLQDTLVEINLGGEDTKAGIAPKAVSELLEAAMSCPHVRIRGLMIIPPTSDDPERTRPYFRQLRELRDSLADSWRSRSEGRIDLVRALDGNERRL